ncbi:MAG: hypothetical protein K2L95_05065 [Alphaproteobacteria bacterium]|nr:hypothetical protein [Alphaproteobacteria bacterium]
MNNFQEKLNTLGGWVRRPRTKKRMYAAGVVLLVAWVVFRFAMVAAQNRMFVFNPTRDAAENGAVVEVMEMHRDAGVLREPLSVKNNRALVSGARLGHFRVGQTVGDGTIVSVAQNIDLDTGMYVVRTRGVTDGLNMAEYRATGYFIPTHALHGDVVMIYDNGTARARTVKTGRSDSENVMVIDGLGDGDIVITSQVADGARVRMKK